MDMCMLNGDMCTGIVDAINIQNKYPERAIDTKDENSLLIAIRHR